MAYNTGTNSSGVPNNIYNCEWVGNGIQSLGYNLQNPGGTCPFSQTTDRNIDPNFASSTPIFDGGYTRTLPLQLSSPAVNWIPAPCAISSDQRGTARPYGPSCDIGAYEFDPTPQTANVTTVVDLDRGRCLTNDCSLREAVLYTRRNATIRFNVSGTFALTRGEIPVRKPMTLEGFVSRGRIASNAITISGANVTRLFNVQTSELVKFRYLNLVDGYAGSYSGQNGGAIYSAVNQVSVLVEWSELRNNRGYTGGAISLDTDGNLTIKNSSFIRNQALGGSGGAIYNRMMSTNITNSTFALNYAAQRSGALAYSDHQFTSQITNVMFADNYAGIDGMVITVGVPYRMHNTVIVNTFAPTVSKRNCDRPVAPVDGAKILEYPVTNATYGCGGTSFPNANANPFVQRNPTTQEVVLGNYGGPTSVVAVEPSRNGVPSPLIDGGSGLCPLDALGRGIDQRGYFQRGPCDIGATEYQPVYKDTVGLYHKGVFRLYTTNIQNSAFIELNYGDGSLPLYGGYPTDYPVVGDWNGDQVDTVGIYRRNEGKFYLRDQNTTGPADPNRVFFFGNPGDIPLAGRWDGTMTSDGVGVFRQNGAAFYTTRDASNTNSGVVYVAILGNPGDFPVAGDWDSDGFDSIGVFRPANNYYYLSNANENTLFPDYSFGYGETGSKPVMGRWISTTDGARPGYWMEAVGQFKLRYSLTSGPPEAIFFVQSPPVLPNDNYRPIPLAGRWSATAPDAPLAPPNILIYGNGGSANPNPLLTEGSIEKFD